MKLFTVALIASCPVVAAAEIHHHGGSGDALRTTSTCGS